MNSSPVYREISLPIPENADQGDFFIMYFKKVVKLLNIKWVAMDEMEAGDETSGRKTFNRYFVPAYLEKMETPMFEPEIFSIPELIEFFPPRSGIDWLTLYCCKKRQEAELIELKDGSLGSVQKCLITLRVVDSGYIYFIGLPSVIEKIEHILPPVDWIRDMPINEMVWPS